MSLCNQWGIPHSEFLEWSAEDRAKAMAFVVVKSMHCDLCGTAEYEWDENRRAYEPVEKICMGCYLKAGAEEEETHLPGSSITLINTDSVEYAKQQVAMTKRALNE
jgi:hypothetical protein